MPNKNDFDLETDTEAPPITMAWVLYAAMLLGLMIASLAI